ncbi:M48 family metallopeptidase [Methylomonas sp. SURF-1]|uniref:M48 family metallopeptidase n=1 Tax=Methylomonas aurea TaxID=2952224 RepID=A0ABT1UL93_9GAMM|nr:M48 family metallopeptidase [Methylomonas sp. SURF-1]MCQ8182435.1 M48 family metallopeptidase [Methylomonas sp. SURF-1]
MRLAAVYYDGRNAKAHPVTLCLEGDKLLLQGKEIVRRDAISALEIQPPLGSTPRVVLFADGARCEVADNRGFAELFPGADSRVAVLENSWRWSGLALLLVLALAGAGYLWGLPYAAQRLAQRIPAELAASLDREVLADLDGKVFQTSRLSPDRRRGLEARVAELVLPDPAGRPGAIEFRFSAELGPNAFALPGGTVVVLDALVELAEDDQEIVAVLLHEMGHVAGRHALRQMLQASAVGLAMAWYIGDFSNMLAAAPALMLEARYSRDFERDADRFAAEALQANAIPPGRLADMLLKLETARQRGLDAKLGAGSDYLSSHPTSEERIQRLRSQ